MFTKESLQLKTNRSMLSNLLKPSFWVALSKQGRGDSAPYLKKDFWELIAEEYDDLEQNAFYRSMQEDIIEEMERRGALEKNYTFFDVACGTGSYTVKIAKKVSLVYALDISSSMLEILKRKVERENLNNIVLIKADWRKYNPSEKFDTVFVSMTPILRDLKEVKRLYTVAKKYFVAVQWAGVRKNLLHEEIEKRFFRKQIKDTQPGFFILFNYFYTLGNPGDAKFYEGFFEKKSSVDKFWKKLKFRLESKGYKISLKKEREILEFLEEKAVQGIIENKTKVRIGALFVKKKED
ncbi:MAG: class I SAM-dependent methyltransferase [Caldimicrobium sp.]